MATYATQEDLLDYIADDRTALRALRAYDDPMIETLLERGEHAVDNAIGVMKPPTAAKAAMTSASCQRASATVVAVTLAIAMKARVFGMR